MGSKNDDISATYNRVLELAILDLRMRIRYDDGVTIDEVHDLMDALHNIPQMIRDCSGWHVPENIDADLARYDAKWIGSDDSVRRKSLIQHLNDVRDGKHDHRA